jgi:hypothetical protein
VLRQSVLNRLSIWAFPVAAVFLVALWQWATVTANYGGNWTALFCTGELQRHPPLVVSEHTFVFKNSTGFDGQFYRYIAHDPFLGTDLKNYVDDQRLRYHRILVPLLAYALALGRSSMIDRTYELVFLASVALGVFWSCRFVQNAGLSAAWGLLFLAMPAVPITMDRLVVDGGLAALTAGFLYYCRSPSWKLFLVLACAALTRETGFLLVIAYCASLAWRREFRTACIFLLSAMPALAWYGYVQANTTGESYSPSLIPFVPIVRALLHPSSYPAATPFVSAVVAADYLALTGALLGFGVALLWFVRDARDPLRIAAALFGAMGLLLQITGQWGHVYTFGRIYTPMLLCLAGAAVQIRNPWLLLPLALMLPRIAIQFAPQALGVMHWIA